MGTAPGMRASIVGNAYRNSSPSRLFPVCLSSGKVADPTALFERPAGAVFGSGERAALYRALRELSCSRCGG